MLGQKIKQARLEAGLSQRQLCGDAITRNMLSLIENGSAQPSMDTLRYLAGQLDKPLGFFLDEPSSQADAWSLAQTRQWDAILALNNPPEYLQCLALLSKAQEAISENRLPYAQALLSQAEPLCVSLGTVAVDLQRRYTLLCIRVQPQNAPALVSQLPDEELLARACAALERGNPQLCLTFLQEAQNSKAPLWLWLAGESCFALEDYTQAISYFLQIEERSLLRLEQCYQKLGDYPMAYHYACRQRRQ